MAIPPHARLLARLVAGAAERPFDDEGDGTDPERVAVVPAFPADHPAAITLLLPPEASRVLRVAVQTLARWRCEGRGPPFVRISGNRVAYRAEDLAAFLAGRRFHSTTEADASGA